MRLARRFRTDQRGMTLTELAVAGLITAIVGLLIVAGIQTGMRSANLHRDDDRAVQDLRYAKDILTRELRMAADAEEGGSWLTFTVDGEDIEWRITSTGELTRSVDSGAPAVVIIGLSVDESSFAISGNTVTVKLVTEVPTSDGTRSLETQIFLRNA